MEKIHFNKKIIIIERKKNGSQTTYFLTAWQHHWFFIYVINFVLFQCRSAFVQGFVQSMNCIYQVFVFAPCGFKFI